MALPTRENTYADRYVTDDIFTALPPVPYSSTEYNVRRAPATRLIDEGNVIDLGDRIFEVLHTPGYSVGEIMLWEAFTGILFSGDMIYDGDLIDNDVQVYFEQMKRIYDMPVRVVHGGDFPSLGGESYHKIISAYLNEKEA